MSEHTQGGLVPVASPLRFPWLYQNECVVLSRADGLWCVRNDHGHTEPYITRAQLDLLLALDRPAVAAAGG